MSMQLAPGIRNGVRAVIFRDDHLLLLRKAYEDGSVRFVLPGGSQDLGETLEQALQRECQEEIGTKVIINGLLNIADFFKPRDSDPPEYRHQLEIFFHCSVADTYQPVNGHHPDKHQVSVEWIARDQLASTTLFPMALSSILLQDGLVPHPVYLGQIDQ